MPTFVYRAIDSGGHARRGQLESASSTALERSLASQGLVLVDAAVSVNQSPSARTSRINRHALLEVTRALAALLPAGMPLATALAASSTLVRGPFTTILADVRARVERGESLADALAAHPASFPSLYIGMVRAGQRSGDISGALVRLAEQLEREQALRSRLLSAAIYPAILAVAGTISVVVLITVVLPRFAELLGDAGAQLPRSTALLLAFSSQVRTGWPLLILAPVAIVALAAWARTSPAGQRALSKLLLATPLVSTLHTSVLSARFARVLGVLLSGGAPLLGALDHTSDAMSDPLARDDVARIRARVREGASLTTAVAEGTLWPQLLSQLVAVGEQSGNLQPFVLKAAQIFEERADRLLQRLVTLAEPGMIVVFGGLVGFVALSLLQAIYGVNAGSFR